MQTIYGTSFLPILDFFLPPPLPLSNCILCFAQSTHLKHTHLMHAKHFTDLLYLLHIAHVSHIMHIAYFTHNIHFLQISKYYSQVQNTLPNTNYTLRHIYTVPNNKTTLANIKYTLVIKNIPKYQIHTTKYQIHEHQILTPKYQIHTFGYKIHATKYKQTLH